MELGRKRKDRVSSKDAAMCRVRAKILQSLPRGSLGQSPRTKTEWKGNGGLFMQRAGEADWLEKEQNQ